LAPRWPGMGIQVATHGVYDVPAVEVPHPTFHLIAGDFPWFADECGQNARFMDAGTPKLFGKFLRSPDALRELMQNRGGNRMRFRNVDSEVGHLRFDLGIGEPAQLPQNRGSRPSRDGTGGPGARMFCPSRGGS